MEYEDEGLKILFEQAQFLSQDPNPSKQAYELEENVLKNWAYQGT